MVCCDKSYLVPCLRYPLVQQEASTSACQEQSEGNSLDLGIIGKSLCL